MKNDFRGVPMTGADSAAIELYEAALMQLLGYRGDPIATIDEAIAASPAFVSGHLLKTLAMITSGEPRFVPAAAQALQEATRHAASANARERTLLGTAQRLLDGDWHRAARTVDEVLVDHPRDALALVSGHVMDFFRGDALNLRNRVTRVLPSWDASLPGFGYVLGMHAFGLEECNQYADAEATARRAVEIERRDVWAIHAAVHVMEMQGRIAEGIAWLESREDDWARDNGFAFHNGWHLALLHLDGGHHARTLALYDRHVHPGPSEFVLSLIDATAMLWRLTLEGVDVGERWVRVADDWQGRLGETGQYAFNDVHAAMAFVATGRDEAIDEVARAMKVAATRDDVNAAMTREVGLPLFDGIVAFGRGRHDAAIDAILPVRDISNRFGGSHAQRDVFSLTLIEAAIRAGRRSLARHYIAERLVAKPGSAWGHRLAARADAAGLRAAA